MNFGLFLNTANFSSPTDALSRIFGAVLKTCRRIILLLFFLGISLSGFTDEQTSVCLSEDEMSLYKAVNDYRISLGLPAIPISAKLCKVAQVHVNDLVLYSPDSGLCNLHSWSANGPWIPCCYTSDHAKANCMWQKPREIAGYEDYGFEISYSSSAVANIPRNALEAWKGSAGHHNVIVNRAEWKQMEWKAIGVGIRNGYACLWFGATTDSDPRPLPCKP
jgi:hypothetical protein